ncbi:twin-arginine translocation protein, TatB subunit [Kribbella flavida DSM 17836]|uniref:Twin-arginine translocation protein, TatB subunit n=1 Tax=Kribbella flavida (strain DSM 17836 / JCM 10339 / NBRC 14399) TaxID=479435 RepID=D2PMC0_KRIFD|nr:sec-independent translocase [Kribbella flavida]ADB34488.1 twin-arginine translocation protein, TatB subunit [Kribbella flavida DSM 17836]
MFGIGPLELVVIAIVAVLLFGPDRLPEFARTAGRLLRQVRQMVNNAQNDLRTELGPEFADLDVRDLNPRSFVRKHLLEGMDDDLDDDKPVSSSMDLMGGTQRLPAGQRAPYDPEST